MDKKYTLSMPDHLYTEIEKIAERECRSIKSIVTLLLKIGLHIYAAVKKGESIEINGERIKFIL